jgi:hypothetical protein
MFFMWLGALFANADFCTSSSLVCIECLSQFHKYFKSTKRLVQNFEMPS